MYALINTIIPVLIRSKDEEANKNNEEEDFWIDEKNRQIEISEKGYEKIERFLIEVGELGENESLYSPSRLPLLAHVQAAIRAHHVFVKTSITLLMKAKWSSLMKTPDVRCLVAAGQKGCIKQ